MAKPRNDTQCRKGKLCVGKWLCSCASTEQVKLRSKYCPKYLNIPHCPICGDFSQYFRLFEIRGIVRRGGRIIFGLTGFPCRVPEDSSMLMLIPIPGYPTHPILWHAPTFMIHNIWIGNQLFTQSTQQSQNSFFVSFLDVFL